MIKGRFQNEHGVRQSHASENAADKCCGVFAPGRISEILSF